MSIHYLIFHPKNQREEISVNACALVNGILNRRWKGNIFVDKIAEKNEDPFVFTNPWLYSYCHATQLKRQFNKSGFVQKGSWLIFVCGHSANADNLTIDTVFLVDNSHSWGKRPLELPSKFLPLKNQDNDDIWRRHLKFPFIGQHKTVSHTYESAQWINNQVDFSYLPYTDCLERVSFSINKLSENLQNKISKKKNGKFPVELTDNEINEILAIISALATTKIIGDISPIKAKVISTKIRHC